MCSSEGRLIARCSNVCSNARQYKSVQEGSRHVSFNSSINFNGGVTFNGSVAFSGSVTFSGSVPFSHCPVRGFPSRYSRRRGASAPCSVPARQAAAPPPHPSRPDCPDRPAAGPSGRRHPVPGRAAELARQGRRCCGRPERHAHGFGHGAARGIAVGHCRTVDPSRDPRDVIADIVQLNDLQAGKVMPGQQLFVPTK